MEKIEKQKDDGRDGRQPRKDESLHTSNGDLSRKDEGPEKDWPKTEESRNED
jgi:hypothetical protein